MDYNETQKKLENASEIHFELTDDYNKAPTLILLGFDKEHQTPNILEGYNDLVGHGNKKIALVIHVNKANDTLNIRLVDKNTGDSINIEGLKFNTDNLDKFTLKEPTNRSMIFILGKNPSKGMSIIAEKQFQPLLINGYEIVNLED